MKIVTRRPFAEAYVPLILRREVDLGNEKYADTIAVDFEDRYAFKNRIVAFLAWCKGNNMLPEGLFFINNLSQLKKHVNNDGSKIKGVERLLENVEHSIARNQHVSGYFFETETAFALTKSSFTVKELSAREYDSGEAMITEDGIDREIDIIAEKEFDGKKTTFNFEVKLHTAALIITEEKNQQIRSFVEISKKQNHVPVVILQDRIAALSNAGVPTQYIEKRLVPKDERQLNRFLDRYSELLIWRTPRNESERPEELNLTNRRLADFPPKAMP